MMMRKMDDKNPSITVNSPTGEELLNPGSVLTVNAVLSDDIMLEEYVVKVTAGGTKSTKNIEEFYFNSHTDTDAYGNDLPDVKGEEIYYIKFRHRH